MAALLVGYTLCSLAVAEGSKEPLDTEQRAWSERARKELSALALPEADTELAPVVQRLLIDPERLRSDATFRGRVVAALAAAWPADGPADLRDRLLAELSRSLDLGALEPLEMSWGSIVRPSRDRQVQLRGGGAKPQQADREAYRWRDLRLGPEDAPIELSVFSLASEYIEPRAAVELLTALGRWAPRRELAVLVDDPQFEALESTADELGLRLYRTWHHIYSPWPRDPMSFVQTTDGRRIAVLRPNRQAGRERDALMGLEMIQELPPELDQRYGEMAWSVAPVPFHNGQQLVAAGRLWLSIHSVEPRALELLGLERVPVESFAVPGGVTGYLDAVRRAADELGRLFGRPIEFVHELPEPTARGDGSTAAMHQLGGGAGFDLDSIVTLLPRPDGPPAAIVGQPSLGAELVEQTSDAELAAAAELYELGADPGTLRKALVTFQKAPRAAGLAAFLEAVASRLRSRGMEVRRLPLLLVPTNLLERPEDYPDDFFLIGWHNVVTERLSSDLRAEGFASGLATGDRRARLEYERLGYTLELLPSLVESVRRNGGYRCASNHIRSAE